MVARQRVHHMNRNHRELCASDGWGEYIRDDLLPWVLGERPLGGSVLEIGPGPGLSTDLLRSKTRRLTAIESDRRAAASLGGGSRAPTLRSSAPTRPTCRSGVVGSRRVSR